MTKKENVNNKIISYLKKYKPERIAIFGSYARGEETERSDLDLLVSFKKSFGLLELVKIERELSELVCRKVDLITERAIKNKKLKTYIQKDLQIIYE